MGIITTMLTAAEEAGTLAEEITLVARLLGMTEKQVIEEFGL